MSYHSSIASLSLPSVALFVFAFLCSDFVLTTDNAYSCADVLRTELDLLAALQWSTYSATVVAFVKLYLRGAARFVHAHAHATPAFAARCGGTAGVRALCESLMHTECFCRVMELVDAAALRTDSLQFYPSALAAAAICLLHPTAQLFVHQCTPYNVQRLHPCMLWLNAMHALPFRGLLMPVRPYFDVEIAPAEAYTRQLHHPDALQLCLPFLDV